MHAGLLLEQRDPGLLARDAPGRRLLVHGLVHLGLVREAAFVDARHSTRREEAAAVVAEERVTRLMIDFQSARRRYPAGPQAGSPILARLNTLRKISGPDQHNAITTFVGTLLVRRGELEFRDFLRKSTLMSGCLVPSDDQYYRLLQLVRASQVVVDPSYRLELMDEAADSLVALPPWNMGIARALLIAAKLEPDSLRGIEFAFDVPYWMDKATMPPLDQ